MGSAIVRYAPALQEGVGVVDRQGTARSPERRAASSQPGPSGRTPRSKRRRPPSASGAAAQGETSCRAPAAETCRPTNRPARRMPFGVPCQQHRENQATLAHERANDGGDETAAIWPCGSSPPGRQIARARGQHDQQRPFNHAQRGSRRHVAYLRASCGQSARSRRGPVAGGFGCFAFVRRSVRSSYVPARGVCGFVRRRSHDLPHADRQPADQADRGPSTTCRRR